MQASRKIIDHEMCDAGQVGKPRRRAWCGNERMLRSAQPEVASNTGQEYPLICCARHAVVMVRHHI